MTYRELAKMILDLPQEKLDAKVVVYDVDRDKFNPIFKLDAVETEVLEPGHPVLMF